MSHNNVKKCCVIVNISLGGLHSLRFIAVSCFICSFISKDHILQKTDLHIEMITIQNSQYNKKLWEHFIVNTILFHCRKYWLFLRWIFFFMNRLRAKKWHLQIPSSFHKQSKTLKTLHLLSLMTKNSCTSSHLRSWNLTMFDNFAWKFTETINQLV